MTEGRNCMTPLGCPPILLVIPPDLGRVAEAGAETQDTEGIGMLSGGMRGEELLCLGGD